MAWEHAAADGYEKERTLYATFVRRLFKRQGNSIVIFIRIVVQPSNDVITNRDHVPALVI
jgi:hypothetical protein